jgi:hypothetical protein
VVLRHQFRVVAFEKSVRLRAYLLPALVAGMPSANKSADLIDLIPTRAEPGHGSLPRISLRCTDTRREEVQVPPTRRPSLEFWPD